MSSVGAANFSEKVNFRTKNGALVKIPGWDFPAPMDGWDGDGLADFNSGHPAEQIAGVRRPNGTYAIVGAGGGFIKVFSYDLNAWVTIGSGYGKRGDVNFRRWQIEDIAGYAVFNNGRDLYCTWQIGDVAVRPAYEFREAGYASAGSIAEYVDGVLMLFDILEINDADMAAVMNDPQPYKTILDSAITTRISFRYAWSGVGDPRAISGSVPGSITSTTNVLTLDWPMASFQIGDDITINGAGAAGGNLSTTITNIAGPVITVADNAQTTVADADVRQTADFESISGFDDIEDDGSAIVRGVPLKTQLVVFKASGNLWQMYYTGDVDTPFAKDRVGKAPSAAVRFPFAIASINDDYLVYPGAADFYRFTLGRQSAEQHPDFLGAQKTVFFERVGGLDPYEVWAVDNICTGEIYFAYRWNAYEESYYGSNRVLAYNYRKPDVGLSEVDGFDFTCAASVLKPLAGFTADNIESWFLMGDGEGKITLFGESNLSVFTRRRYGDKFEASYSGGLFAFGADDAGKYLRRFSLMPSNPRASAAVSVTIYGAKATNIDPVALITKQLTNPRFPGVANLHYRQPYYKYRIVTDTDEELSISAHIWRTSIAETQDVDRLS